MLFPKTTETFDKAATRYDNAIIAETKAAAAHKKARSTLTTLESDLETATKTKDRLIGERDQTEQDILQQERKLPTLGTPEERTQVQAKITALRAQYKTKSEDIAAKQSHIDTLKKARATATQAVETTDAALRQVGEDVASASHNLLSAYRDFEHEMTGVIHSAPTVDEDTKQSDRQKLATRATGRVLVGTSERPNMSLLEAQTFYVGSEEFEHRVNNLLDYLNDRRIAEEMDTQTYLLKLQTYFEQASEHAGAIVSNVLPQLTHQVAEARAKAHQVQKKIDTMLKESPSLIAADIQQDILKDNRESFARINDKLSGIVTAQSAAQKQFEAFQDTICTSDRIKTIKQTAGEVSRKIEKGTSIIGWPVITGIAAAVALRLALNAFPFPLLIESAHWLCAAVFGGITWASVYFGRRMRTQTMDRTQWQLKKAIADVFNLTVLRDERFALGKMGLDEIVAPRVPSDAQNNHLEGAGKMIARNIATAAIPACSVILTGLIVQSTPDAESRHTAQQVFVGAGLNGKTCALVSGVLVHADRRNYYVLENAKDRTIWASLLFPSHNASKITKDNVIAMRPASETQTTAMRNCTEQTPLADVTTTYVIPQGGCSADTGCTASLDQDTLKTLIDSIKNVSVSTVVQSPDLSGLERIHSEQLAILEKAAQVTGPSIEMHLHAVPMGPLPTPDEAASLFLYSLQMGEDVVIDAMPDTLLMFFNPDITKTANTPYGAYKEGLDGFNDQNSSAYEAAGKFYLEELGRLLAQHLQQRDAGIALSVAGFATDKWEGVPAEETALRNALNLALADGRRAAVLASLKASLTESDLANVFVTGSQDEPCIALADWTDANNWEATIDTDGTTYSEMYKDMVSRRADLMDKIGIDPDDDASLRATFQRSAFVEIADPSERCDA